MMSSLILGLVSLMVTLLSAADAHRRKLPEWEHRPQSFLEFYADDEMILKCAAKQEKKIMWLKNDKEFHELPSYRERLQSGQVIINGNYLMVKRLISRVDSGNYTCVVETDHGELKHTVKVNVRARHVAKPSLIHEPRNVTVSEGETAVLYCLAVTQLPSYTQWLKHDQYNGSYNNPNSNEEYFHRLPNKHERIVCNATHLMIYNVTLSDAGRYSCVIINDLGDAIGSAWISVNSGSTSRVITFIVMVVGVGLGVLILFIVLLSLCYQYQASRRKETNKPECKACSCPLVSKHWQLDSNSIKLCEPIGEGAFGRVYRGLLRNEPVAVKMLKEFATEKEVTDLMKEVSLMTSLQQHDNVIKLLGCSWTPDGSLQLIMEYATHGNLRDFLRTNKPDVYPDVHFNCNISWISPDILTGFALQIARGMEYLASLKIIHRDLAARNILVAKTADNYILKIADFGLTREAISNKDYYRHLRLPGRLPIKWMSPESMTDNIYTMKSDVWSFGILLWEIFTYGDNPYPSTQPQNLYTLLKSGYRMPCPVVASDNIYDVMTQCWKFDANCRPTFAELVHLLSGILDKEFEERPQKADVQRSNLPNYVWNIMAQDDNGNVTYDMVVSQSDAPLLGDNDPYLNN